ncbi:MAG TPA: sigma-70 family RNA polymerase sigma factor [Thermoanaerobaculia bacterium]|nr:sigma-70 family RNA polymerase sigma factor [Thermoanaerobaculia bacterium]
MNPSSPHSDPRPEEADAEPGVGRDGDARLLDRVAGGDQGAFEDLYHRYHRRLFGYLLRVLRRPALIEEVLDDVMLAVWQGAHRFDGRSRASTWILGIAHHKALKALDRVRRESDREGGEPPEALDHPTAPGRGPERAAARSELRTKLRSAMEVLSPVQRAVVELTFFYGYSYPEIAEIVGCPVGTVKTRMFHARRLLKERLPELGLERERDAP